MHASSIFAAAFAVLACATTCRAELLRPSNLPDGFCDDPVAGDSALTGLHTLNTDTDCTEVVPQPGGPDLCVVRYRSLFLLGGSQLVVSGSRPLVLSAAANMSIEGSIDVSDAGSGTNGADLDAIDDATGGGGGGFGGTGGDGGSSGNAGELGGPGGPARGAETLVPLIAGGAGGHGSGGGATPGGKGGGALQLVACGQLSFFDSAVVRAIGRGGSGGPAQSPGSPPNGGGGGGSGGALLIEADTLYVRGLFTVNGGGGGGGGGGVVGDQAGQVGADGGNGAAQATGGLADPGAGAGGLGGAKDGAATNGADATDSGAGGGGGGAAGRIWANFCSGIELLQPKFYPALPGFGQRCNIVFASGFEGGG